MLEEITVRDFALIDNLSLRLSDGFNIFSGETGAGKSLLIGAINFLLGTKAEASVVRAGADECLVCGTIDVARQSEAQTWLSEHGIESDDDRIIIRRSLKSTGRGAIYLQGQPVTRADLLSLTGLLVDMHGQHEHQTLLVSENHRKLLDRFAHIEDLVQTYAEVYRSLQGKAGQYETGLRQAYEREREIDFLRFEVEEIEQARLKPDEETELATEEKMLSQHEKLFASIESAHSALSQAGEGVLAGLRRIRVSLQTAGGIDPRLADLSRRLDDAFYEIDDVSDAIRTYGESLVFDPARLELIESRLAEIHRLKKKYGSTIEVILERFESAKRRLSAILNWDEDRAHLESEIFRLKELVSSQARILSTMRCEAAKDLGARIQVILRSLGMPNADFTVSMSVRTDPDGKPSFGPSGNDEVEFLIAPNPGSPPGALSRIASGGELSRVALAVKTILAHDDHVGTLVFDEIDAGIGGEVAASVGRHLKELGESRQVLCITHLASIAVRASSHYMVEKEFFGGRTTTRVVPVSGKNRTAEIARMLAGDQDQESSMAHAAELLRRNSAGNDRELF